MLFRSDHRLRFPRPELADREGLVAIGGDMSAPRLLLAYRSGLFPWTVDPITWWSPEPRGIFELDQPDRLECAGLRRAMGDRGRAQPA